MQHGGNNLPYYDVQINNNITAGGTGQGGYGITRTYSFRSDMYRLTVSAASSASLTLQPGTTLRTYENMNLLGTINMNGDGGTMAPDNWTASSKLDCGQNATIGSAAVITMNAAPAGGTAGVQAAPAGDTPIGANAIVAEGNLTIQPGTAVGRQRQQLPADAILGAAVVHRRAGEFRLGRWGQRAGPRRQPEAGSSTRR